MKDNSNNTIVEMTTEEFHKLLEENICKHAELRTQAGASDRKMSE